MKTPQYKSMVVAFAVMLILGVCFTIFYVIPSVEHYSWATAAPGRAAEIATYVEGYRNELGIYPKTLPEIATNTDYSRSAELKDILLKTNKFRYKYEVFSNTFSITVSRSPGFPNVQDSIVVNCKFRAP